MTTAKNSNTRLRTLYEVVGFFLIGHFLKMFLDEFIWRYSGPVSLVIMLTLIFFYMRRQGQSFSSIGLIRLSGYKSFLWLVPQTFLAFLAIMISGIGVAVGGEALGIEFMTPDASGAENRFGDIAGNTPLYLSWLAILWIAGPAEELYFRGFFISKLRQVFGSSKLATVGAVIIPAIIFGVGHMYYLGLRGLFMTGAIGLALGTLFVLYKRNIYPLMVAHAAFNSLSFTAVYLQLDI